MSHSEHTETLFHELCRLEGDARARRLAEIARTNPEAHARVLRLLVGDRGPDALERLAEELDPAGGETFFHRRLGAPPEPAPGLHPGKEVGEFRLIALLGQGGMGQVWEALQVPLGRRVALKFLLSANASEKQLELFQREARAGGRLSHPGVVAVHAHGRTDGLAWIAMELVDGSWTLRDFLDEFTRKAVLPEGYDRQVVRLVAEIADAVQAAHDARVIHRDLKPQNVLITPEDHAKVTDFGLARIADEPALSATGDFAGTYYYMSPEQVAARRAGIDHRTDVFSLGVLLYELLTLRRPFEGDTTHQVAAQILAKEPPDPRTIRSRVPRDLAVIACKALEKDPDKRYLSMRDFAADLRRWLADEPIVARPPGRLERALKWARRHPARSVAGVLLLVGFVIVSGLLYDNLLARRRAEEAATRERQRAEEVLRLSAFQDLRDLRARADELWPVEEARIQDYAGWIEEARRIVGERVVHRSKRDELRARISVKDADPQLRWWERELTKLVDETDRLEQELLDPEAATPGLGWSVARRLAFAEELQAERAEDMRRWEAALPGIRDAYPGLRLEPQLDLVPLGPDPTSGLWEFADRQSGVPPERDEAGHLQLSQENGLVFVLLPGGEFDMGAQRGQPAGANYDPDAGPDEGPVHRVRLSPFFLSKYEMTQGQWMRLTGKNPSAFGPHYHDRRLLRSGRAFDLLHPVDNVVWGEAVRVCRRHGFSLPSEAQWEYAARAETSDPWWIGPDAEALAETGNVLDRWAEENLGKAGVAYAPWSDGATVHAPIGTYVPNPFGLHEMLGNVWEWCLDVESGYGAEPATDPVVDEDPEDLTDRNRVRRGGAYSSPPLDTRSANRGFVPAETGFDAGLRPLRVIR